MPSVLYIESDPTLARSMSRVSGRTWTVTVIKHVSTIKAALEALSIERFDVIVSAYSFEDGTGYDLVEWLANFKPTMSDKLVFLTGSPEPARELCPRVIEKGTPITHLRRMLHEVTS